MTPKLQIPGTCVRRLVRASVAGGAIVASLLAAKMALAAKTFFIGEAVDYTVGTHCDLKDVNTITATLQSALTSDGWTGTRLINGAAWPQHFIERCSSSYGVNGKDFACADAASLAVFAGHGSVNSLAFSSNAGGRCSVSMTTNARLGTMSGAQASFGMWLACQVLQGSLMGTEQHQWLRQQAGFQNSIAIGNNEPRDFYNATISSMNADAWLNKMSTKGRNAIIVTTETRTSSNTVNSCWGVHNTAKLRGNLWNIPRGGGPACGAPQAWYWYCYETRKGK